jgi:hypothetical protein
MRKILHLTLLAWLSLNAAPVAQINPADLQGTWQLVSVRDMKTGTLDQVEKSRTLWLQVTKSHWTYVWADLDRKVLKPEELARLAPEQRRAENYSKIWDAFDRPRFWGAGGGYTIEGNRFVYTGKVSIEPHMMQHGGVEIIAKLDRDTYVRHSVDKTGTVVRESIFRRLD